jgi:hypothetical protein
VAVQRLYESPLTFAFTSTPHNETM